MSDDSQRFYVGLLVVYVSKLIYLPPTLRSSKQPVAQLILRGVSFYLPKPSFIAITGPSGSGKSTLLRIISGIEVPTTGQVVFNGQSLINSKKTNMINFLRKNIYFVFQDAFKNFIPSLTVLENAKLIYALGSLHKSNDFLHTFSKLLKDVDLSSSYAQRICAKLSGGEQQKVALLLALLSGTQIILADEPTGNLNSEAATQIWTLFKQLRVEKNFWIIAVSHNPDIHSYVDRSYSLRKGLFIDEQ